MLSLCKVFPDNPLNNSGQIEAYLRKTFGEGTPEAAIEIIFKRTAQAGELWKQLLIKPGKEHEQNNHLTDLPSELNSV